MVFITIDCVIAVGILGLTCDGTTSGRIQAVNSLSFDASGNDLK